jgi:flagellum-specific peptidoglycan hydrolase FlgJ
MTTTPQNNFLRQAAAAASAAGHIFPDYAACEAALESTWGRSRLAREANNLFGQKQSLESVEKAGVEKAGSEGAGTLALPTQEYLNGRWVTVIARWARFTDQAACFRARMALLHRLQQSYPAYARACLVDRPATRRQGARHPSPALFELPAACARTPSRHPGS